MRSSPRHDRYRLGPTSLALSSNRSPTAPLLELSVPRAGFGA